MNQEKAPPLGLSTFSLESPIKAASTFVQLHNMIMPNAHDDAAETICSAISTKEFNADCNEFFLKRIREIKRIAPTIKSASFQDTILKEPTADNMVEVKWREIFTLKSAKSQVTKYHLKLWQEKITSEWKIKSYNLAILD